MRDSRHNASTDRSGLGVGAHAALSGSFENVLRNFELKGPSGFGAVGFAQESFGLGHCVTGVFLETISLVDGILVVRGIVGIQQFFLVGSNRQGFPFDVLSEKLDDSFVRGDFGTTVAETTVSTVFVELDSGKFHGFVSRLSIDDQHARFVAAGKGFGPDCFWHCLLCLLWIDEFAF